MNLDPSYLPILDLLGKGSAILLLAFAAQRLWRRGSAAQRSLAWLAAFLVLAVLPAAMLVKPRWAVAVATPAPTIAPVLPAPSAVPTVSNATVPAMAASPTPWQHRLTLTNWCLAAWATGGFLVLAFRLLGGWQLHRLRKTSVRADDARLYHHLDWLAEQLDVSCAIEVRQSAHCSVPLTWGWLKPVLLLPADASHWDDERLDAALRHELGHIRHHDARTRWLATVVCALWWPLPWVWMANKAWKLEQEKACDDLVLRSGASPQDYAMQLLYAARSFSSATSAAMAMARPSTLETRLRAVMDEQRNRRPMSSRSWAVSGASAMLIGSLCVLAQLKAAPPAGDKAVAIAVQIIEISKSDLKQSGIASSKKILSSQAQATLTRKLLQYPSAKLSSYPRMLVRPGVPASIKSGVTTPQDGSLNQAQFTGFELTVTSALRARGLHLDVKVQSSYFKDEDSHTRAIGESQVKASEDLAEGQALLLTGVKTADPDRELACIVTQKITSAGNADPGELNLAGPASEPAKSEPPPEKAAVPGPAETLAGQLRLKKLKLDGATLEETLDYLRVKSRDLDPAHVGLNIVLADKVPDSSLTLDLVNVPITEALHYSASLAGLTVSYQADAVILHKADSQPTPPATDSALAARAKGIILPKVMFNEASLEECTEYLQVKSADLDPAHQGINIVLKAGTDKATKITLSLMNVSLLDALNYLAQSANLQLEAEASALVIAPK